MTSFGAYAHYYDWFYRDKPYADEVEYLLQLASSHGDKPDSILELGVGTGGHAVLLAERLNRVVGVDMSADMLAIAEARRAKLSPDHAERITLHEGDIRSFRIADRFPLVASLFHVISYQCSDEDVRAAFQTARHHLVDGGLFIFDVWHGPGVIADPPESRSRSVRYEGTELQRVAVPKLVPKDNLVEVTYNFQATSLETGDSDAFSEVHTMRYFFEDELREMLREVAFEPVSHLAWMTRRPPETKDWSAVMVARAT